MILTTPEVDGDAEMIVLEAIAQLEVECEVIDLLHRSYTGTLVTHGYDRLGVLDPDTKVEIINLPILLVKEVKYL